MRNKRFFIVLGGALLFGLVAAVSVSRYLSSAQAYTKSLNGVVVAKVAIPLGTKIIPEQLTVVQFPAESTPDGAFQSVDAFVQAQQILIGLQSEALQPIRLRPLLDQHGDVVHALLDVRRQVVQRLGDQGLEGFQRDAREHAFPNGTVAREPPGAGRHRPVMNIGMTMLSTTTMPTTT